MNKKKKIKKEIAKLMFWAIIALMMGYYVSHNPEKFGGEAVSEQQVEK